MRKLRAQIRSQGKLVEKYRTNIQYINGEDDHHRPLVTQSPAIHRLIRKIENFGTTDATVLLQGETGVGKDVFCQRELARRVELSLPAIGYRVERGQAIADENTYRLIE